MKLIIDIPKEVYKCVMDGTYCGMLYEELKNGVPVDTCGDCVSKKDVIKAVYDWLEFYDPFSPDEPDLDDALGNLPTVKPEPCGDAGEISDGYHTFNQLYYQRAILFAAIVNQNKGISWKSYKHSDGKYCFDSDGEWFVVGIDTPKGSYTYHYSKKYWNYFDCIELERGKEWDGHTEDDVIRLLSLPSSEPENTGYWIVNYFSDGKPYFTCSRCQCICTNNPPPNYCEDCGSYNNDWEVSK